MGNEDHSLEQAIKISDFSWIPQDEQQILDTLFSLLPSEQKEVLGKYLRFVERDLLTGLYNERRFDADIDRAVASAARHDDDLSLLLVDLDNLKRINDGHGRITAGDAALKALASYFPHCLLRPDDTAYRLHGDEYAVIAERTPLEGGIIIAERIRRMAEASSRIYFGGFTVSIGVANGNGYNNKQDLIHRADIALGLAKARRNSVVAYTEQLGLGAYAGAQAAAK